MPKPAIIDVTFDRIRQWVDNPDSPELSAKDKEIWERWDFAYDQLKKEKTPAVVNRLMRKFGISNTQAYLDIKNAQKLLSPINRRETDWIRNFLIEDAIERRNYAIETNNQKAWAEASNTILKIYIADKNDQDGIDPKLLGHNNYFIAVNIGGKIEKLDYDKLHKLPIEKRVEYTDFLFPEIENETEVENIMNS